MRTVILLVLAFVFASPAWAEPPADSPQTADVKTTLNVAAHYLDGIFSNALASLEIVAVTPEARSGDWKGIKPYLQKLEARLPGAYFFVLPDGNYYSVDRDYTNLNLSDRPYFKSLFAGNPVKGFPIYSRSTGKKSALVAAPIVANGKVTGALGASVFLDDLNKRLDREFALPSGYAWYVLNSQGNTMLDKDSDLIFMNALTQGGPSLHEAVAAALKSESGAMQYDLDGIRRAQYMKLPTLDWWMFLAKVEVAKAHTAPEVRLSLDTFVPALQHVLDQIDADLASAIEAGRPDVSKEDAVRELLSALLKKNENIIEAAFVDSKGMLRYIEPRDYRNFENTDISAQEHVSAMLKDPRPLFTASFKTVEGYWGVVDSRPLYDSERRFVGSINLVIRPELLVGPLLEKTRIPSGHELWIMQPDGKIIYDQDPQEIGKTLFTDPTYAGYGDLLKLGKRIAAEPSGEGSYVFLAPGLEKKVIKKAAWRTVGLHDRAWRVVLAYRPYE
jgi:hypothetical protein